MTDQYAVMGNPINHSKSPVIHTLFAQQTAQDIAYRALLVEEGSFESAVNSFFSEQGKGLNITVPFKQEAWKLAQAHSPEASLAQAVNTLFMDAEGQLQGHNTDGIGLVRDITQNHHGSLADKSILLLGAGGASRGILLSLLGQKPSALCIANRTVSKAHDLVEIFNPHQSDCVLEGSGFADLAGKRFDWVINATSASLQGDLPPLPQDLLNVGAWCYDLMYSQQETVFCQWASNNGAFKALDGLGMLVEQAAESFYLWRGVRPKTSAAISGLS